MRLSKNNRNERIDCPSCGAESTGGLEGCLQLFKELGSKEFSDPEYFKMHRLSVDAYCLQHPEQYMVSSKSAAAHLTAMCWSMEKGISLHMPKPLKIWVDGARKYNRVEPPPLLGRGKITIVEVLKAKGLDEYERLVWDWAKSAWDAWGNHWEQARSWVQQAINEYER